MQALPQAFAHAYKVGAAGKANKLPCRISSISFKDQPITESAKVTKEAVDELIKKIGFNSIDELKKEKDLLSSLNWKQWTPGEVPVFSAEDSLAKFKVAPGFKVELVASEPFVKDPVFVDWDDQGRMWVGELRSYMMDLDGTGEYQAISRVMVLEDTNRDGKMDKATPFLEDMVNVRCLAFVEEGVLVVESGALWLCLDKDGDLRCDQKEKLLEFATTAHDNIEHAENALHFALDNWMYNSKSTRKLAWRHGLVTALGFLRNLSDETMNRTFPSKRFVHSVHR